MKYERNAMSWNTPKVFDVTEEHMKLLDCLCFGYNSWTEFGAPEVDPKRPYGNSYVHGDIAEILGIKGAEGQWGAVEYSEEEIAYMNRLHREMETVLQILVRNAREGIRPGAYATTGKYSINWFRLGE